MTKEILTQSPREGIISTDGLLGAASGGGIACSPSTLVRPSREEALLQKARDVKEKLACTIQELQQQSEVAKKAVGKSLEHSREQIRQHPLAAVVVAAGIGVIIGLLINKRR